MAPTSHVPSSDCSELDSRNLERKTLSPPPPPPPPPRNLSRNSYADDEDSLGFLGKLSKFEMLASGKARSYVSPKVFPLGASTTNVPAERILVGARSRSSSLVSLSNKQRSPSQSLVNLETSRGSSRRSSNSENDDPRLLSYRGNGTGLDGGRGSGEYEAYARDFDASLLLAKTTTTEIYRFDKFGNEPPPRRDPLAASSNATCPTKRIQPPSPAFNRNPRYDESKGCGQTAFAATNQATPNELRDEKRRRRSSGGGGVNVGGQADTERRRRLAQEERLWEQEVERRERSRLEEILAMCAEYERQSTTVESKPRQPNRIKTNGSLPREGRPGYNSPFGSPESPIRSQRRQQQQQEQQQYYHHHHRHRHHQQQQQQQQQQQHERCVAVLEARLENGGDNANNNRNNNGTYESSTTTPARSTNDESIDGSCNNNNTGKYARPGGNGNGNETSDDVFSGSVLRAAGRTYENVSPIWTRDDETTFEEIRLNGARIDGSRQRQRRRRGADRPRDPVASSTVTAVTLPHLEDGSLLNERNDPLSQLPQHRNNNRGAGTTGRNDNVVNSCEMVENKLTVSNERLLEAIQRRLSAIATRGNDTGGLTPKRNNTESDDARSNEAKAERERARLDEQDRTKYIDFLRNEREHVLGNIDGLERSIADIELQEEEIDRELELEKALLSAEYDSESLELTSDESDRARTRARIEQLEREMAEDNLSQAQLQAEAKRRVQRAQRECLRLEEALADSPDGTPDDSPNDARRRDALDKLALQQDILECERKAFEDLEFHHLEEEASKLATREELQRHLSELSARIEGRRAQLDHLVAQRSTIESSAAKDGNGLGRQKLAHAKRLDEARGRLRAIEEELENLGRDPPLSEEESRDEKRSPSRQDFDRISRVTTDSPITVDNQGSLGRKTIESLKEIERNRQLHLAKQGSQVISEERRRVEELKQRVQDEVRHRWEQDRRLNRASFNSLESSEESSSYSTGPADSGSGSSDGADALTADKSDKELGSFRVPAGTLARATAAVSAAGSSKDSYAPPHRDDAREGDSGRVDASTGDQGPTHLVTIDETESRPLSQTSSEMESLGPLVQRSVKHRDNKPMKLRRPLTRYLPIKSESLDLRNHIETAGHQLALIHDVSVDATSCSGYLSKMSKKFHHWNKRWFVFDRKRKTLSYYSDSASSLNGKKPRGLVYFQSIEEVYVDHMNTVRSPQPSLTFVVKTTTRLYHLMAPSPEAMRVWVDVVFTGAEGYHEFDHAT